MCEHNLGMYMFILRRNMEQKNGEGTTTVICAITGYGAGTGTKNLFGVRGASLLAHCSDAPLRQLLRFRLWV